MTDIDISKIDPAIHSPVRIGIMSVLISNINADFIFLKKATGTTDGNLSSHLSKLENLGFIKIIKSFSGKKPHTTCQITSKGSRAFRMYIDILEDIISKSKVEKKS